MEGYPYITQINEQNGTVRYRFRRKGRSLYLPGEPGHPDFEEHYRAAKEGRDPRPADAIATPGQVLPKSFADSWRLVQRSAEWKRLDPATKKKNSTLVELFLSSRLDEDSPDTWGSVQVSDMKRRHIRAILADHSETPHKAKHLLTAVRRLVNEALDQDWIEHDPTLRIGWRPSYTGWRAWTMDERKKFEAHWTIGTQPRAAYALALWLGLRRGDVASIKWSDIDFENKRVTILPGKKTARGQRTLKLLLLPMLEEALVALPRRCETVLATDYKKSFSEKSLTGMMAHWTKSAEMAPGATFHGLRKTLGKYLAECGATAKQAAGILGHDDLDHVELYSREAEQETLAVDGLSLLLKRFQ